MRVVCLFVAILFLVAVTSGKDYCGPWIAIDVNTMKQASPSDVIAVRYLAAPLMYCSVKDELTLLNGYHGGVAFTNLNTSISYTINYDAYPSFYEAVFPGFNTTNGNTTLEWSTEGRTFVYEGVNSTYWHVKDQVVAKMTGSQYNRFVSEWLAISNKTFTRYDTVAVYKHYPDEPWLSGFECFQYVFEVIKAVQELGGQLTPGLTHLNQAVASIYSRSAPQVVDFNGRYHQDILNYFSALELKFSRLGLLKFIGQIAKLLFQGDAYLYFDHKYYKINARFPYFGQHWTPFPLLKPNMTRYL